jgi:ferrous iron transport protein A|tara:strand:+ start:173 stop:430 length:258 start_codon:yes stop_codon:yes gene_type:complete
MKLAELERNQTAYISELPGNAQLATKLLEQGFAIGTEVSLANIAPFGGPLAVRLHNTKISIQNNIATQIKVDLTFNECIIYTTLQ